MTAGLYINENSMDRSLVTALRARGADVLTAIESGMIERDDIDHLRYSTEQQRVLLTSNFSDFCRLHTEFIDSQQAHAGIICVQQQTAFIGDTLRRLQRPLNTLSPEDMTNRLEFLANRSTD